MNLRIETIHNIYNEFDLIKSDMFHYSEKQINSSAFLLKTIKKLIVCAKQNLGQVK